MKNILLLTSLMLFVVSIQAQPRKVKERELEGRWKLVIDIDSEDFEDELDEEDGYFARLALQSVGGFVDGVLDAIDIEFEFMRNNEVKVIVSAFGNEDIEYSDWRINRRGELLIGDTDSFSSDDDDYWMFDGDLLVAYDDDDGMKSQVYMVNID